MLEYFNVQNYFAYFKICCYTSLKFLSLGVNTGRFICSLIQNKQKSLIKLLVGLDPSCCLRQQEWRMGAATDMVRGSHASWVLHSVA